MKNKRFLVVFAVVVFLVVVMFSFLLFKEYSYSELDVTAVNDVAMTANENLNNTDEVLSLAQRYDFDVSIFDDKKELINRSNSSCAESISKAVVNRDTIVTLDDDGVITGYVVIRNNQKEIINNEISKIRIIVILVSIVLFIVAILYVIYLYVHVISPFDKLKSFASSVAAGNLDMPLKMDRGNLFGAFTESFDLMRDELSLARKKEWEANQSKKELVASLSHDIKTPVASIKATTELLEVTTKDERVLEKLSGIDNKADQIELLINNLFNATLEELLELNVTNEEENSLVIADLIKSADYSNMVEEFSLQSCYVYFDKLRLGQVFDNIISNSYKYAGTKITVENDIEDGYFVIRIRDYGTGLSKDEVLLCCEKFWRGSNSKGKNGSGLGLYISSYFCKKMGGELEIEWDEGFVVIVRLPMP